MSVANVVPFDPDEIGRTNGEEPPPDRPVRGGARAERRREQRSVAGTLLHFRASHGACTATWDAPLHVAIDLDRFSEHRGELRAEVVARYTAPGLERQLGPPRAVPLLGPRASADLAKALRVQMPDVEWEKLIEQAFTHAIRAHRDGEPAILLPDVPVRLAPRYALEPLVLHDLLSAAWS